MAFKLFKSKGHQKSHKSHHHHKKSSKAHHHGGDEEDSEVETRKSYASERHVDSPRVAARKLLVSIMMDCEQGNDDDSFDKPSRDCPVEGSEIKARTMVAPELPTYNDHGNKSLYSDDDMKPLLQQMGDSVDSDDDEISSSSHGPPKEIFPEKRKEQPPPVVVEEKGRSPTTQHRLSNSEERSKEFKALIQKFKPLDGDEEARDTPAEKERQNIYDMEWFAKMEKDTKSPLRRNSADLAVPDTPTTHEEADSMSSEPEGPPQILPEAPLLSESEDIDSVSEQVEQTTTSHHRRELRRMRTSGSCQASKNDPIYRQQSYKGEIATSYSDLFESARKAKPVFEGLIKSTFDLVWYGGEDSMLARFADLKSEQRAIEKAQSRYSNREPGPALSWLYDIVRGSVLFTSPEAPMRIIEALQHHPDISVVNIQNKYTEDGLEAYKVLNLHLQIDTRLGFQHICEMQIHQLDVETLDLRQVNRDNLEDVLEHRLTTKQLERLSYLFSDQLCQYDWAEVVLNALLKAQLGRLGHGNLKDAETYCRIGKILNEHLNRSSEAVAMYEKELEILKMHLGIHDMKVAESSAQIGDILHAQGETERALEYYGKAVEILELHSQDKKEEDYSWVKGTREDISNLISTEEEVRESLEMYSKSLDKYKMTVEEGLSNLHRTFEEMHNSQSGGEKLQKAIQTNNESIDESQRTLVDFIPQCRTLAEAAKAQGTIDEVFEVFAKSLIQSYQLRSLQQVVLAGSETKEEEPV